EPRARPALLDEDVLLRLSGPGESEGEERGRGDAVSRSGGAGGGRGRCEAVLYGDVCLEPGAAHPRLDHLSLEGVSGEGDHGEGGGVGLARRPGSNRPLWPGADVQLPENSPLP